MSIGVALMSPQAWPLPKSLTSTITCGMKTSFLPTESTGNASGSGTRASPGVTRKPGGHEATEAKYEQQDKRQQASQRSNVTPRDTTMLPRISERNSTSSSVSDATAQTAADIVKETRERLGNLGVSVLLRPMSLARSIVDGHSACGLSIVRSVNRNHFPDLQNR